MKTIEEIEGRRKEILELMSRIRSMRPGNINYQYMLSGKDKAVKRGPYPVLCWREGKSVYSERLKGKREVELAELDIANMKHYRSLCSEYEELTRRLGEKEREKTDWKEEVKKGRK